MGIKRTSSLNKKKVDFEILIKSKNNYLVSLAVGKKFLSDWKKYVLPFWLKYCKKHKLGLLIIKSELSTKSDKKYKKSNWQKLLISKFIFDNFKFIKNICYLDTDIIINEHAPNIFESANMKKINVVSLRKNLPFDYKETISKIVILRKNFLNKKYPVNSSINLSLKKLYSFHKLKEQPDEFCTGVLVFQVKKYYKVLENIFNKYNKNIKSITNDGEQTHLNYELQSKKHVNYLSYKFQAIWLFEMANYYSFLYKRKNFYDNVSAQCIESSLINNYFLHFPGSWVEGKMWKNINIGKFLLKQKIIKKIKYHLNKNYSGKSLGMIKDK